MVSYYRAFAPKSEAVKYMDYRATLIRCVLPINQCQGQAYDGASNMSSINNGVQALFKAEAKQALYVHCLAHSLNLFLKDVTNTCEVIRDVLNFIYELTKLTSKRLTLFDSLRREVIINTGEFTPHLRMLCPTRWTARHTSIATILRNYSIIQSALEEIRQGHDEYTAKASGMASKMKDFDTFFWPQTCLSHFFCCRTIIQKYPSKGYHCTRGSLRCSASYHYLRSLRNEKRLFFYVLK